MKACTAGLLGLAAAALAGTAGVGAQERESTIAPVPGLEIWDGFDDGRPAAEDVGEPAAPAGTETGEASADVPDAAVPETADEGETGKQADAAEAVAETGTGEPLAEEADDAELETGSAAESGSERSAGDDGAAGPPRPAFGGSETVPPAQGPEVAREAAEESGPVTPAGAGRQGTAPVLPRPEPSPPVAEVQEPRGSLWRLLDARAERAAGETAAAFVADMAREGCPRDLLGLLLGSATDAREALTAVALEREVLELCRRRQEAVAAVLEHEAELREIVREMRTEGTERVVSEPEDWAAAIEAVPQLGLPGDEDGAEEEEAEVDEAPAPAAVAAAPPPTPLPAYRWFTLAGSGGDLRAGVTDGTGVWFVRAGDALPGETWVAEISADPPAVRVAGATAGALPWGAAP